jgi:hypothetical protein
VLLGSTAELLHERVDVIANVVGTSLGILHDRVAVASAGALATGLDEAAEDLFGLGGETLKLVGDAAPGIRPALWGKQHAQGKPQSATRKGAIHPNLCRALP